MDTKNLLERIQCAVVCLCENQKICFESETDALKRMTDYKIISILDEDDEAVLHRKK